MALLEAMAAGCAIVASRVGGIPDIIRHEEDALLIDPTDETDLTRALERLLLDVSLRERFATSARRRFLEEFEAQRMSARYVDAYSTVAAGDA
jgi:glycosyltransferase involved in cell wall biosynthesis